MATPKVSVGVSMHKMKFKESLGLCDVCGKARGTNIKHDKCSRIRKKAYEKLKAETGYKERCEKDAS